MPETLAQLVRKKYPGAYDDLSDSDLEAKVDRKFPGAYSDIPRSKPEGMHAAAAGAETIGEAPWYTRHLGPLPSVTEAMRALPAVGGFVGGALASPGVVTTAGGAALGGAAGEAARQLAARAIGGIAPATSGAAALDIGKEAAIQGAAELGGRALATGAKALGRGMVENAVRPTMTLQGEFPGVIETILKERLPVGKGYLPVGKGLLGGAAGSERAAQRLAEESQSVKALLRRATAGGKSFETSKVAKPAMDLLDEFAETEAQNPGRLVKLEAFLDNFLASKKGPLSPLDVQKIKQAAQKIAKPIYKAVARGENVGTEQGVLAQFNSALASGAKQAMETVPGVAEGEATKRSLIGAQRALTQAERRRLSLMAESASGLAGALGGALGPGGGLDDRTRNAVLMWGFTRGILHPRQMSRVGLALTSDQAQAILRQFPRLAEMIFRVASSEEQQPAVGTQ